MVYSIPLLSIMLQTVATSSIAFENDTSQNTGCAEPCAPLTGRLHSGY